MPTTQVQSSADTYVNEAQPNQNFGQQTRIRLRGSGSSHHKRGLIFFRLPNPAGATILYAKLHLRLMGGWGGSQTITIDRIIESWGQNGVTWNRQPNQAGLHEVTEGVTGGSDKDEHVVDVTGIVQDASLGSPYYGFRLAFNGGTDLDRDIYSSDAVNANLRPYLEVKWTNGPSAPTNLSPAGGRIVEPSKPTLTWKFNDDIGEAYQVFSQVQISTSVDFSSPAYDSGLVSNTVPTWDLSEAVSPSFTAMSPGDIRYWRVRVKDDSGIVSPWSDVASFERQPRGVLTLVNPAASPSNIVDELTPPLDWTFTGTATQQHVLLYLVLDTGGPGVLGALSLIYRWQDVQGSSVHVPLQGAKSHLGKFPGLKTGKTYEVVVRVWDEFDREGTPGDPAYLEVSRQFTYHREGSPAPVTTLDAVADGPAILLSWARSTEPDSFGLRVDRQDGTGFHEEVDDIDPEDAFVSGTSYQYRYWGAAMNEEWIYEVEAKVISGAGKGHRSNGNATAHAKPNPYATWLVDPDDSTYVVIYGDDQPDVSIGSSGTTYDPLGARKPVRIIDNVRGLEGSVSGTLLTTEDRDTFIELYGRMKELRLIISDVNIPIEFDDPPSVSPAPEGVKEGFAVSLSFFQSSEFGDLVPLGG